LCWKDFNIAVFILGHRRDRLWVGPANRYRSGEYSTYSVPDPDLLHPNPDPGFAASGINPDQDFQVKNEKKSS
jgi:hypothetical protein